MNCIVAWYNISRRRLWNNASFVKLLHDFQNKKILVYALNLYSESFSSQRPEKVIQWQHRLDWSPSFNHSLGKMRSWWVKGTSKRTGFLCIDIEWMTLIHRFIDIHVSCCLYRIVSDLTCSSSSSSQLSTTTETPTRHNSSNMLILVDIMLVIIFLFERTIIFYV